MSGCVALPPSMVLRFRAEKQTAPTEHRVVWAAGQTHALISTPEAPDASPWPIIFANRLRSSSNDTSSFLLASNQTWPKGSAVSHGDRRRIDLPPPWFW